MLDLNAMLTQGLNTVEAAPEFVTPDNGVYDFEVVKIDTKHRKAKDPAKAQAEGKKTEWYDIVFTYGLTTVQLESDQGFPVRPGSLIQEQFQFTDTGLEYFKTRVEQIVVAMGGTAEDANSMTVKDVIDTFPGAAKFRGHCKTTKETYDGKEFTRTRISQVVAIPA